MKSITLLSSILLSPMLVVPTLVGGLPAIAQTRNSDRRARNWL